MKTTIETTAKTIIAALHKLCWDSMDFDLDSIDHEPRMESTSTPATTYTFEMTKYVDAFDPSINARIPSHNFKPVGQKVYTVTVTEKFVKFDDE
jgi:hypothetical protein